MQRNIERGSWTPKLNGFEPAATAAAAWVLVNGEVIKRSV